MLSRSLLLLICLCLALSLSTLLIPSPSLAIGKATPTPADASEEELDVEEALEEIRVLLEEKEYKDTTELASRILEADTESWEAYYYRGFAYARLEDYDSSIADFDEALEIRPWHSGLYRLRGDIHLKNKNPRQAKSNYERSLFYSPRSLQTYFSLVGLHERDVDKTIHDIYQAIVEAGQANAQGSSNRAHDILTEQIDKFARGKVPTELGYAYFARSNILAKGESWERALEDLEAALELQPEMQDYYMARGYAYSETENVALAAPDFYRRMKLIERESIEETLEFFSSVAVEMDYGVVARLRFQGEAGQLVTIAVRDNLAAGVDPLLVLLDAEGNPVAGDDDGGGETDSLISDYELPANGIYTAMVSHANAGYEGVIRVSLR